MASAVAAGERRRRAMLLLQQRGRLPKEHEVLCELVPPERALEVSLAENSGREAMHPADEFEAFKALIDEGYATDFAGGMALEARLSSAANSAVRPEDVEARRLAVQVAGLTQSAVARSHTPRLHIFICASHALSWHLLSALQNSPSRHFMSVPPQSAALTQLLDPKSHTPRPQLSAAQNAASRFSG